MTGTLINFGTVIAGTVIGMTLKGRMPARIGTIVMQGVGLFTLFLGFNMAQESKNLLVVLFSVVFGAMIGEALDIEARLDALGRQLERRFAGGDGGGNFTKAFVMASILFCVGPMTIVGAIEDGLRGNYQILLTKAIMDGFSSIAFSSTLGIGVGFSALVILVYQGAITLAAASARAFLSDPAIAAMTGAGGLMIIGIGINLLELKKVRVGNMLPALVIAVILGRIFG
ncbi:MAG: DUF554 domain-containing protein [Firmicutes bacterium]|nr:DUF554 domain-containing protein [Bacillota bacterium]